LAGCSEHSSLVSKTELLVFITPKIVTDRSAAR
jgi:type II secretory pathway component GspD/PulD (secretin)